MYEREIPGRGRIVLATHFVESILARSRGSGYRIVVVDDGHVPEDLRALLARHGHAAHTYPQEGPFSFARKANFATSLVASGIVILLNDDLEVIAPDWIETLAGQAARPGVGAVGCRLLFADGSLQHAGIGLGFHGATGHMHHGAPADGREYGGFASITRNYSAVTGAVMAYRKDVFDAVGGFDERFGIHYNDVDFCLRCIAAGYRIVYTPAATLYHFYNSSLRRVCDSETERAAFLARWGPVVARDPFFSRHFQTEFHGRPLVAEFAGVD
jgi:cellulose synthase/poly-beta-1,6-N-acetylglucosamine synthase-like glycosyltransferase